MLIHVPPGVRVLAMDVHKNTISAGLLEPDSDSPLLDRVSTRTQLVEAAWAYKSKPHVGVTMKKRQEGLDPAVIARAWTAQLRLRGKFRRLDARKSNRKVVVTAIARQAVPHQSHHGRPVRPSSGCASARSTSSTAATLSAQWCCNRVPGGRQHKWRRSRSIVLEAASVFELQ